MAAKKGVPNPNAGRRPGSATRLTRKLANDLIRQGFAPLEIMISNMMFWHRRADLIASEIEGLLAKTGHGDEASQAKYHGLLRDFLEARTNAQKCAVEAAPYCHPRLQSVAIKPDSDTVLEVTMNLAPLQGGEDRSYRDQFNRE